ncbi:MAG: DUF1638 domain-containing protein [Ardenticatenaceae bacterium]|nr:DUF1638 domain-containing protein [Ardenticatenaceae bacterium]HBY98675.1 hypothetical protein [Chloroflexota bacterium]
MTQVNQEPETSGENRRVPKTVFIACAALGRDVKAIIRKHGWNADFQAIDARLHLRPDKIGPAVEARLQKAEEQYERRVVVYGHCGAMDLDAILGRHGAVRPLGPHCYEMYGGEDFARALKEEPGTFILTDYLIHAWDMFVVKGLKIDQHPKLKPLLFHHYKRLIYYSQEEDERLIAKAHEIAAWLELPLTVKQVGYGDLERRLVAIMEEREQPTAGMTYDGYSSMAYPTAAGPDSGNE